MWSRNVLLLLGASALSALASALTYETALMLLMENLRLTHDAATLTVGVMGFAVALFAVAAASAVDQLVTLWLPLGAAAAGAAVRLALAALVTFGAPGDSRAGVVAVPVALLAVMTLDSVLVAQPLTLCLNGLLERKGAVMQFRGTGATSIARIFGVRYSLGNVAALLATVGYDLLRTYAPTVATANAVAQWLGLLASGALLLVLVVTIGVTRASPLQQFTLLQNVRRDDEPLGARVRALLRSSSLWRFAALCLLLLGTGSIFRHIDQTLPPVLQRLYTKHVHFAALQAINPAVVITLAPVLQYHTARFSGYWVVAGGALVSSLALVPLVVAGGTAQHRPAGALDYLPAALFLLLFSVGESLWSARFTAYVLEVAPHNNKALYVAIASLPGLGARLVAAWHSAWMVAAYCPSADRCAPRPLWATVLGLSLLTPVAMTLFYRWLNPHRPLAIPLEESLTAAAAAAAGRAGRAGPPATPAQGQTE